MADAKEGAAVKVAVRVRPLNEDEIANGAVGSLNVYRSKNAVDIADKQTVFNYVYDSCSTQTDVYEECAKPMIDKLLDGFNCTLFAYGQSGSGKTYTMGTDATMAGDTEGIIPRLLTQLFARADALPLGRRMTAHLSMLEIYAERVRDLLVVGTPELSIRCIDKQFVVVGLTEHLVRTVDDAMKQLQIGCRLRAMACTKINAASSRSHALITLSLQLTDDANPYLSYRSKLNMVDLAGSERLSRTGAVGIQLQEGIKINKGLMALGGVFMSLVKRQEIARRQGAKAGEEYFVNYRDSQLTRVLADSLGGNSHTLMIACVSPADTNYEETISTLRYAATASKIKNNPHMNKEDDRTQIVQLKAELERVRAMYAESQEQLREALAANERAGKSVRRRHVAPPPEERHEAPVSGDSPTTRSGRHTHRPHIFGGTLTGQDWHNSMQSPAIDRPRRRVKPSSFAPGVESILELGEEDDNVSASLARTPEQVKKRASTDRRVAPRRMEASTAEEGSNESSSSSDACRCRCQKGCNSKRCLCRSLYHGCSSSCVCQTNGETCINPYTVDLMITPVTTTHMDTTYSKEEEENRFGGISSEKFMKRTVMNNKMLQDRN